jgi:hypothetical protein
MLHGLGRNDPCHCGSGRKYKKCCLDRESGFASEVEQARWEWEKRVLLELYDDYAYILRERRIALKACAIALTDSDSYWAQWNPATRTILISRRLVENHNWFQVVSILKHEMAHQLMDESYIPGSMEHKSHGDQFKLACQMLGLPEEYARATINLQTASLDWRSEKNDDLSEKMLEKVRKLLSLANSSNEHEAVLAMNKVREIYAKYNLDEASQKQRFAHLILSHGKKRIEAHQSRIISILVSHFFVQVITIKLFEAKSCEYHVGIEIIGKRENVMMAEYVYQFLIRQTDFLVTEVTRTRALSRVQKKSYRLGILAGFSEKLRETERASVAGDSPQTSEKAALITRALSKFHKDKVLDRYLHHIYPKLSKKGSGSQYIDGSIFSQGRDVGQTITLNRPITHSDGNRGHLLK